MVPPMLLNVHLLYLAKLVCVLPIGNTQAILVDAHIVLYAVLNVNGGDLPVYPIDLVLLVSIMLRFRTIVFKPRQLRGIKEGADSNSVGGILLVR